MARKPSPDSDPTKIFCEPAPPARPKDKMKSKDDKKKSKKRSLDVSSTESKPSADTNTNKRPKHSDSLSNLWVYEEVPEVAQMPISDVEKYYEQHQMSITGHQGECFKPVVQFKHTGLPADLVDSLFTGFDSPTPIQAAAWPIALRKRDLIAIAETGSGKTLGFTVPAIMHIHNELINEQSGTAPPRPKNAPLVLVILPTRELAMQVATVTEKAGESCGYKSVCVYGGVPKYEQVKLIRDAHFVVGTPGRLVDLAINDTGSLDLSRVSMIILDEADRMLDLGFEKDIRNLMGAVKSKQSRHTLMFSATWPAGVRKLASEFLVDSFVKITIGDENLAASQTVTQHVQVLPDSANNPASKQKLLIDLINKFQRPNKATKILVFALYKKEAQRLEDQLRKFRFNVEGIHGDKNQAARSQALHRFRTGECSILVATDVAARGLDIPNVEYVINVTFPLTIEDYVHRIGRTGRAGKPGISHTLFTSFDKSHSGELVNVLKHTNQCVPEQLVKFGTTVKKKEHSSYGAFFKEVDPNAKGSLITFDSENED